MLLARLDYAETKAMAMLTKAIRTGRGHDCFRGRRLWNRTHSDRLNLAVLGDTIPSATAFPVEEILHFEDQHATYLSRKRLRENMLHCSVIKNILMSLRLVRVSRMCF